MFYQSYDIMVKYELTLRGAAAAYFASYLQPSLLNKLIIPQMAMALALGLFGIFICVANRERNISRTKVKIHKI